MRFCVSFCLSEVVNPFQLISGRNMQIIRFCIRTLCLVTVMSFLAAPTARAAYTITLQQQGTNVFGTGSGSLDLTDLTLVGTTTLTSSLVDPSQADVVVGIPEQPTGSLYQSVSGPAAFGTGA